LPTTDAAVPWYRSLRWRLTLSFVGLLAVLLAVAGAVEVGLLSQAVLNSRAQTLRATFSEGRAVVLAEERARVRRGLPALPRATVGGDLARLLAEAGVKAAVYSTELELVASAGPGAGSNSPVQAGVTVPAPAQGQLLAAAQGGTGSGPTLVGSGAGSQLVMLFPLTGALGRHLGVVELAESAGPVRTELGTATAVVAAGSAAVLVVALLIGLWITSRGLGPLRRLTQAAAGLGRGDLSQRSGLSPRGDEVGMLAAVFDEMADSVERTVRVRQEAERHMRQFIADASHELRTPLTAIKGYLEVLQRGGGASLEEVRGALPVMSQEADRMHRLVLDLLTLARADDRRSLQPRPVELGAFLGQFLEGRQGSSEISSASQGQLSAMVDPDALSTIVSNLHRNAERHGQGSAISWGTEDEGAMVGLRCTDQGPGIPAQDLPHVFERFYRASGSRSRQDGGSGLGLAIVQALAEAQGGRVYVDSKLGHGASFTVLLPAVRASGWTPPRTSGGGPAGYEGSGRAGP
jgi:two-component system OmpR family sensor kinase